MSDFATTSQLIGSLAEVKGALLTYTNLRLDQTENAEQDIEQLFIAFTLSAPFFHMLYL